MKKKVWQLKRCSILWLKLVLHESLAQRFVFNTNTEDLSVFKRTVSVKLHVSDTLS